jgi:flagellar biosynthetic protein FliQ
MLTPEVAVDMINDALHVVMLLVVLLVTPGLVTGLLVSLFQAATQINEQTLGFLPRLLVTLVAMSLTGRWIIGYLMDFCVSIFQRASSLLG